MVSVEECFYLGKVFKTHGINGDLSVKLDTDNVEQYEELESVFLEINKKLVPFFVNSIRIIANDSAIISFWDIETENDAKELIGASLYLPDSLLPNLSNDQYYYHDLKELDVIDSKCGFVGIVTDVIEFPQQMMLEVKKNKQEILIPITDDIIEKVDKDKGIVFVNCPEGLLDLNI